MSIQFKNLLGKTLSDVTGGVGDAEIVFTLDSGEMYRLYHEQDCCESVSVESIVGNLSDLVGSPILMADEAVGGNVPAEIQAQRDEQKQTNEYYYAPDSETWTFYKLATIKGYVDIRFLGESNGYYSESVDFARVGADRWADADESDPLFTPRVS